jgi:hypothetical protein
MNSLASKTISLKAFECICFGFDCFVFCSFASLADWHGRKSLPGNL